jgi:hypothetical protein
MINGSKENAAHVTVPDIPAPAGGGEWRKIIDTAAMSPEDILDYQNGSPVEPGSRIMIPFMGLIALQSRY